MTTAPVRSLSSILVTGGAGFIGSAFIRTLFRDASFTGHVVNFDALTYAGNLENLEGHVDDTRYTFVKGDIKDQALMEQVCREHKVTTIVHFFSQGGILCLLVHQVLPLILLLVLVLVLVVLL